MCVRDNGVPLSLVFGGASFDIVTTTDTHDMFGLDEKVSRKSDKMRQLSRHFFDRKQFRLVRLFFSFFLTYIMVIMSRQIDVFDDFYLVGHSTTAELTNITYNGLQIKSTIGGQLVLDGIAIAVFAVVLVKDQSDKVQNGIYRVTKNGAGADPYQLDRVKETFGFRKGKPIFILNGDTLIDTAWITVHTDEYTVTGVTELTYSSIKMSMTLANHRAEYQLVTVDSKANNMGWTTLAVFPWVDSRHSNFVLGKIVTVVDIANRALNIRYRDVTNNVTLGQVLNVNTDGSLVFPVTNPTTDATIELQISKSNVGGTSPLVRGCVVEYIVN